MLVGPIRVHILLPDGGPFQDRAASKSRMDLAIATYRSRFPTSHNTYTIVLPRPAIIITFGGHMQSATRLSYRVSRGILSRNTDLG